MNRQTAIGLIVGVLFFFLSLYLIKDKTYYFELKEVPEVVYLEIEAHYKKEKKKGKEQNQYYVLKEATEALRKMRVQESNNYTIAFVFLIGGFAVGSLLGGYLENRKSKL